MENSESSTLFVADVPFNLEEQDFVAAFQACDGFVGARLRTDRNENVVGFVDFTDHESAAIARDRLQGYKFSISDEGLTIHFSHGSRLKRTRDTGEEGAHLREGYRSGGERMGPVPMIMPMSGGVGMPHTELGSTLPFYSPMPNASFASYNTYPTLPNEAVSTLYVEGLPLDATEREVAHIFRPWPGFLSLRILPKESKQYPNRTYNLCFVEFDNKYQATMALHALQGYKMDKNDTKGLNISYAKTARKERRKPLLTPDQPYGLSSPQSPQPSPQSSHRSDLQKPGPQQS